jgi:hypothetical protein
MKLKNILVDIWNELNTQMIIQHKILKNNLLYKGIIKKNLWQKQLKRILIYEYFSRSDWHVDLETNIEF